MSAVRLKEKGLRPVLQHATLAEQHTTLAEGLFFMSAGLFFMSAV
jgi:hypothetical protein